jgi:flagellar basal body-associated protein FliL
MPIIKESEDQTVTIVIIIGVVLVILLMATMFVIYCSRKKNNTIKFVSEKEYDLEATGKTPIEFNRSHIADQDNSNQLNEKINKVQQ